MGIEHVKQALQRTMQYLHPRQQSIINQCAGVPHSKAAGYIRSFEMRPSATEFDFAVTRI